jgi:dihydrofolate reductase
MFEGHHVAAVVAIGKNRELGMNDKLLWHIPDDLKRFKELTTGHPVIFGRKTFESIVGYRGKPLSNRTNIIVTRDVNYSNGLKERGFKGVLVASSLADALEIAKKQPGSDEIHIGGGAQMYEQALPHMNKLYLTLIDDSKVADTFFPSYEHFFTKKTFEEDREWNGLKYQWVNLER